MKTGWVRVGAMVLGLIAANGCGRQVIQTSPALVVPRSPAHESPDQDAQRTGDAARRQRQSTGAAEHPGERDPRPAPMLGVADGSSSTPKATSGNSVVITTVPAKPSAPQREGAAEASAEQRPNVQENDRDAAVAVLIAGVLIGAIKLVPRWTDRA